MTKLKAVVFKGPAVVGNAIAYGLVRTNIKINRLVPFTIGQLDCLQNSGTDLANDLVSHRELRAAVTAFKNEWKGQKPLTETAPM